MARIIKLFRDRNFVFVAALVCGLAAGQGAAYTQPLVVPSLAMVMTLATLSISGQLFRQPKRLMRPAVTGMLLSYLVQGGVILLLAWWLVPEPAYWQGLVVLAAVPPAVVVMPLAVCLDGDPDYSLVAMSGAYVGGLLLIPLIFLAFFGGEHLFRHELFVIILTLIVAPMAISRLILWRGWEGPILRWRGGITNWGFFLVLYTIVGLNRQVFLHEPWQLLHLIFLALASTLLVGEIVLWAARRRGLEPQRAKAMMLIASMKNYGLASGLCLALFGPTAAVPTTVATIAFVPYLLWLSWRLRPAQA
jgi:BASS family bile acid:Na+ symporter